MVFNSKLIILYFTFDVSSAGDKIAGKQTNLWKKENDTNNIKW